MPNNFLSEFQNFFREIDHIRILEEFRKNSEGKAADLPQFCQSPSLVPFLHTFFLFCNRGDTIQYHGGLRSRELCQAPMLLVFLTPRQALSSHPRQCFCASLKLLFFMIFVGVHEFSSRLTTFSSCRRRGSNR